MQYEEDDIMWCTTVPIAPPGSGKNTNYRFSRFFVRSVPLFRSLMLTAMYIGKIDDDY